MTQLESYFQRFRENIIGINQSFESPYGEKKIIYADWIASGRLYAPIEEKIKNYFGPFVANTHSEASETGTTMTHAYHLAQKKIKKHVNVSCDDVLIATGNGMTGAVSKFQRIIGLKVPERIFDYIKPLQIAENERPVVFVTHMEHHSNHTSWNETIADVVILEPDENMQVCYQKFREIIKQYADRKIIIGAFSACSNVTGIQPDYYQLARIIHEYNGFCVVDFAASAPYLSINMHPADPMEQLDAIFFSPHKFLGGPGSNGILIFNKALYNNKVPDHPGGGTVRWTNRWNEQSYIDDIEAREDGGTPGFLQTIRVALAIELKEQMGCKNIHLRENELIKIASEGLKKIKGLHNLEENKLDRIGVFSFFIEQIHHNLVVKLLNDRFGIQVRGGCSCAGTYGHFLLNVDLFKSKYISSKIEGGDLTLKPGWVRLSLHPTMTNDELYFILDAIEQVIKNIDAWREDYYFDKNAGEFFHKTFKKKSCEDLEEWFKFD
jgi:selenocysteine lyase/cysteine desulfurase